MAFIISRFVVLLGVFGARGAWSLYCYNCLSLDKYNPDCVVLNGQGKSNVNVYYIKCSDEKTVCSLHIGRFEEGRDKPRIVVTRKCDYKWDDEPDCRDEQGPDELVQTSGWTCKCSTNFCNWREGVDTVLAPEMSSLLHLEATTQVASASHGATPFSSSTNIFIVTLSLFHLFIWN